MHFVIFYWILISAPISTSITPSHTAPSHTLQPTHPFNHSIPTLVSVTLPASYTRPLHHSPNPPTNLNPPHKKHSQKRILIAFGALGGLVVSVFFLGLLRCCYKYKKAPKRDRIAEVLSRHHLQRELEELERNHHVLQRPSLREPAPPYCPAPPSYDVVTSEPTIADVHTDMDTRNLSSSPLPSLDSPSRPISRRSPIPHLSAG